MTKIIYIVSTGHSGSTLLDLLIGTFGKVFSAGEFKYFTWQLYRTRNGEGSLKEENICTCRERFQECKIWSEIIAQLEKKNNLKIIDNPLSFNTSAMDSYRYKGKESIRKKIVSYLILFEMYFLNNYAISNLVKKYYQEEINNIWKLVDEIGNVMNVDYVVDSTKSFLRYYLLKKHRPDDVFLVINSRDNMGFANSFLKRGILPKDSLKQKKKYNNKVKQIIRNISEYYTTTYDIICQNPEKVLMDLAEKLNLEYSPGQSKNINTNNYHLIAGNPMRYKGRINIKHDRNWENDLTDLQKMEVNYYVKKYGL